MLLVNSSVLSKVVLLLLVWLVRVMLWICLV